MQITDEGELWALLSAILQCKFGDEICREELAGMLHLPGLPIAYWQILIKRPLLNVAPLTGDQSTRTANNGSV